MSEKRYQDALTVLRRNQIRITPQRQAVLKLLVNSRSHPTAEAIFNKLKDDFTGISIGTVYNNLRLFKKLGIIQELTYGNEPSHFDYAQVQHFHVVCQHCGKVVDVFYPDLTRIERLAEKITGYQTSGNNIEVYGLCPDCQVLLAQEHNREA
ncbi:Fur family transcriptional regulator [Lapidilactobacillus gannanensis]|jgi:Fur family peroxide stress response transcriptional regulator|uniref:Fur family transcriptional regulator n=1 Tax=Lapidilactobacillus gannanensis TaxID=2486002 RepID=A0ABW4BLY5_9LACO|nr:Fur family transcriptional regulator [Lapidilactobacillus gannanensis]MCH4058060.1 transcriptional repressor [Lactobacillaceae bacterium]